MTLPRARAHPLDGPPPPTASSSSFSARAILLQQANVLIACAERLESNPDGYERAVNILHQVLQGEPSLDDDMLDLARVCSCRQGRSRPGKLILSGVGKSGHVARKVTATLQSTGSMAVYLHPTEALHGDMGVVAEGDALVLFSHWGRSDELLALVEAVRRRDGAECPGNGDDDDLRGHVRSPPPSPDNFDHPTYRPSITPVIVITGDATSLLGLAADAVVDARVESESDLHVPAPTASTTLALAMGDCIALELARRRGFGRKEFARNHPGEHLGRALR